MLLVADVGNSSVKFAVFDGDRIVETHRVRHIDVASGAELPAVVGAWTGDFVAVSVSSSGLGTLERRLGRSLAVLGRDVPILVRNAYETPEEAGADRLANAAAAHARTGGAAVAVDAGSAVTVDAVGSDGTFLGGAIAPGLPALRAGLARATPALPAWDGLAPAPGLPRRTIDAIRAGVLLGLCGAVERLVDLALAATGDGAGVLLTGGDATLLASCLGRPSIVVPHLTLEGARLLFERAGRRPSCT
jgi:type III pantothenate kinase